MMREPIRASSVLDASLPFAEVQADVHTARDRQVSPSRPSGLRLCCGSEVSRYLEVEVRPVLYQKLSFLGSFL
jgi:hypothetical protein